jgi:hypothetical protein
MAGGPNPCPAITISPSVLPDATVGIFYSVQFTLAGGAGPFVFSVFGTLPLGLNLDATTGILSGYLTTVGPSAYFAVNALDANQCGGGNDFNINVLAGPVITIPQYRTGLPTLADQYNRLQHFMCCIGRHGNSLSSKLITGMVCDDDVVNLEILCMFWSVLECYDPTIGVTNCLTQTEIDLIWDYISQKCGICFSPYGTNYTICNSGVRITQNNGPRIVNNGRPRIIGSWSIPVIVTDGIGVMILESTFIVK